MKHIVLSITGCLFFTLIIQAQAVLYGVAGGGSNNVGVLFSFATQKGTYTKLVDFSDAIGAYPSGSLVQADDGKLYGMCSYGGNMREGVLFSYNPLTGVYADVFNLGGADGGDPNSTGLMKASNGKLYGLTNGGVSNGRSVLFSLDPATARYATLFDFSAQLKGVTPMASLIQATDGKLYGVTDRGLFSFDLVTNTYTSLFSFTGPDGSSPAGSLVQAKDGKLYGTTTYGGMNEQGVLFSFDPASRRCTKLLDFGGDKSGNPVGSLLQATDGKLYGLTPYVIFSFDPRTAQYTTFGFGSGRDYYATGNLMQASDGKLYGMTQYGGKTDYYYASEGVLFSFDPKTTTVTQLWDFDLRTGGLPYATGLVEYKPVAMTRKDQAITFEAIADQAPGDTVLTLAATTSSGLPVSLSVVSGPATLRGDTLTITGGGSITVRASQKGNKDYNPAPNVDRTFCALTLWYRDADEDGWGNAGKNKIACTKPQGYVPRKGDWNDYDAVIYPGAPELCDGRDNDQNGKIDDGLPQKPFYWDHDKDGYGFRRPVYACAAPRGYISVGGDFNDNDSTIHPGATEHCDGIDEDCDGIIDNGFPQKRFYKDRDGDGWGSNSNEMAGCAPPGYVKRSGDCNDYNAAAHPGATEIAGNGVDDNCNGQVDESITTTVTLYGMTQPYEEDRGGTYGKNTVFSFTPSAAKTVQWCNIPPPLGSLVKARDGNLYGAAVDGGSQGGGAIFSFNPNTATYKERWAFKYDYSNNHYDSINGGRPMGSLLLARDGKLYGMTIMGGKYDQGVIFSFDPITGAFKKIHDFNSSSTYAYGSLVQASDGKLYGAAYGGRYRQGSLFSFDPLNGVYKVVYDFDGQAGIRPNGGLLQVSDGKLYGLAEGGTYGAGVVFSFDPATLQVTKILDFTGSNGADPIGIMIQARNGKLYGTTDDGGTNNDGTIFSIDLTTMKLITLWDFTSKEPYYSRHSELMQTSDGKLYGTSFPGIADSPSIIYSLNPSTATFSVEGGLTSPKDGGGVLTGHLIEYEPECTITYYQDKDKDSYGSNSARVSLASCTPPQGYVAIGGDCNDEDASIHPGIFDADCDGKDNNCNGLIDEHGNCSEVLTKVEKKVAVQDATLLHLSVAPNPSHNYFNIYIKGGSNKPIQLQVMDAIGRVIERRQGLAPNSTMPIGHTYRPGVYYVEALQGREKASLKLVKLAD